MNRCGCVGLLPLFACALLTGCGSSPPPPRSASAEISDAERCMETAQTWERKGEIDLALDSCKRAKEAILNGKSFAEGTELARLRNMEDEVRAAIVKLETRQLAKPAETVKAKPVDVVQTEDPEEKKRKEQAEVRRKKDEDAKKATERLAADFKTAPPPVSTKKKDDEGDVPPPTPKTERAGGKTAEGEVDAGAGGGGVAIQKATGPFPALTEKSPALLIPKVMLKGKFVVAYFQLYNNQEQGKRIMAWGVFFKDANNAPLIHPPTVGVFQYDGFKPDVADLIGGQSVNSLGQGTHQVTGFDGLRLVAVGEGERAKDVKAVAIKISYLDGTNALGTWSGAGADAEVPGLKSLGKQK